METLTKEQLKKSYNITAMIGVAMVASLIIYALVVEFLKSSSGSAGESESVADLTILRWIFYALAVINFFAIGLVKRLLLSDRTPAGAQSKNLIPALQKLQSSAIVSLAFCEAVAIFGLVLFFLGRNSWDFYGLWLISFVLFGLYFPRFGEWENWLKSNPSITYTG